jgi:NitT/TauT family transport system substrate-binding protein
MKISKTEAIFFITGAIVASVLSAVFFRAFWLPPSSEAVTVRVGYLTADLHQIAYFVAKDKTVGGGQSFFEKYGVNVTDAASGGYAAGGNEMDAFLSEKVDIGMVGAPPSITKYLNLGVNITIIAQTNEIGSAIIVDPSISKFSDLKGKTVAVPNKASIQYFLLLYYAEQNNVKIEEINVPDETPVGLMNEKLKLGTIAGYVAWEPFPAEANVSGIGKILATSNDIWPHHLCCVLVAHKNFAAKYPNLVVNFLKAFIEATNWINEAKSNSSSSNFDLLVNIGVQFTGRNFTVIQDALSRVCYKNEIDTAFRFTFIEFTNKLIDYQLIPATKLQERGYSSVYDFADDYINETYLSQAKK